ncbi:Xaa-Pro aminopeptidase [Alicyclobacillus fastidiosus]|uniref:Xaa-Pro aminopeptidase n=1 Tax=Alicyclobacillus fastidiosus TaxID=392011 RepID=A0ABY6ZGA2_9BACL|nr:aminopeptidase P family protein [Alicyclobacillus fastidiosus]WAH41889.1 Xaa-Pro aminopeptidase [Alicyclobacillus fastidiosus]GMA63600.1 Xaa-Pro aminopeptidase [Alicyclobacillus fastidiosus]
MFDSSVFEARRVRFCETIADRSIAVLFSGRAPHKSRDASYHFHANRNFFYLTGVDRENAAVIFLKKEGAVRTMLFTEHVDATQEKWTGKRMSDEEATHRSGIEEIRDIADLHSAVGGFLSDADYDVICLDLEQNDWHQTETVAHQFSRELAQRYPGLAVRNIHAGICRMRAVKDAHEVAAIREAIRITKLGIENLMSHAHGDVAEYELQAHFDFTLRSNGVSEHAFPSIIAGGERATVLHYEDNDQTVADGELVLLDLGAAHLHYSADISRTFPVNGKFTPRQKELYEIVLTAMEETIAAVKPGMSYPELNEVTKATLARECKRIGLIERDDQISNYYYHSVSHPLGLDTHDVHGRGYPIEVGSVITIEPGLYVAEEGIGIRIEDDILVTATGVENLSSDIIKSVADIEALMARRR